jgi:hypothetical protein
MSNTAPSSTAIPKWIKSVHFLDKKKSKKTKIGYNERYKPTNSEDIITSELQGTSDQIRHPAFDRAMEVFAVHAVIRTGFEEPKDRHGKAIDEDWFKEHLYEDDERFNTVKVTGIIITSKSGADKFQILYEKEAEDGAISKIKSPSISLIKVDGWNYSLQAFAQKHLETLLIEAAEFHKGKSANGQLTMKLVA